MFGIDLLRFFQIGNRSGELALLDVELAQIVIGIEAFRIAAQRIFARSLDPGGIMLWREIHHKSYKNTKDTKETFSFLLFVFCLFVSFVVNHLQHFRNRTSTPAESGAGCSAASPAARRSPT